MRQDFFYFITKCNFQLTKRLFAPYFSSIFIVHPYPLSCWFDVSYSSIPWSRIVFIHAICLCILPCYRILTFNRSTQAHIGTLPRTILSTPLLKDASMPPSLLGLSPLIVTTFVSPAKINWSETVQSPCRTCTSPLSAVRLPELSIVISTSICGNAEIV